MCETTMVMKTSIENAVADIQSLREMFEANDYLVNEVKEVSFTVYTPVGIYSYEVRNNYIVARRIC